MRRRRVAVSFAVVTLFVAGPTWAQQTVPAPSGSAFQVGLRFGYGSPFGKIGRNVMEFGDDDLSATIERQIPIGVDFGYLFTPNLYLGLSFMYGFGSVGTGGGGVCNTPGVSCSTSDINLGVEAQFRLKPAASFDPWLGIGIGYEWLDSSATIRFTTPVSVQTVSASRSGFELAKIELGADISIARNVAAGPFVSFSAGRYTSESQTNNGDPTVSSDLTNPSFHEWLMFGLRGVYDIRL